MQTEGPTSPVLTGLVSLAKAFATAVLSLAVGVTLCLALLLGGTAMAGG